MATLYALNLNFDPTASTGLFQPYNSSNNTGRAWFKSTDGGGNWQPVGNPDSVAPVLSLSAGDKVQLAVSPSTAPASTITGVTITVIFSTDRRSSNHAARVASPFQLADCNPRCVLADAPGTWQSWQFIGPYDLGVNRGNSGSGRLKFEFALAARVTFADGTVKDYGYDPEMDVDV